MGYWQDFYQDSSPLKGPAGVAGSGESAIQALTDIGFDKSQIILGIPAYGKGFKRSGETVLKESLKGSWDTEDVYTGIFEYTHIMFMVDDEACDHNWTIERYLGSRTGDEVCSKCGATRIRERRSFRSAPVGD